MTGKASTSVVYICDENYHRLTLWSMASMARAHATPLAFSFFQVDYRRALPAGLAAFLDARGHACRLVPVETGDGPAARLAMPGCGHISGNVYLKALAIDEAANEHDYVLYLDGDVLVFDDLGLEAAVGFGEICAAVLDITISTGIDDANFFANCAASGVSHRYVNAGVMLINGARWRSSDSLARFERQLRRHEAACPYLDGCRALDQCVFNLTFEDDVRLMPFAMNMQQSAMHTRAWRTAAARHFTGPRKFLPIRWRNTDMRQYALLRAIARETGLRLAGTRLYDAGLMNAVNTVRRRRFASRVERHLEALHRAHPETAPPR